MKRLRARLSQKKLKAKKLSKIIKQEYSHKCTRGYFLELWEGFI